MRADKLQMYTSTELLVLQLQQIENGKHRPELEQHHLILYLHQQIARINRHRGRLQKQQADEEETQRTMFQLTALSTVIMYTETRLSL